MSYDELNTALKNWPIDERPNFDLISETISSLVAHSDSILSGLSDEHKKFMAMSFDEKAGYLMTLFDWLDRNRRIAFEWVQSIADEYGLILQYSWFEDKIDTFKNDLKEYPEQKKYLTDLGNLAVALKVTYATKHFDIKSTMMKEKLSVFVDNNLLELSNLKWPQRFDIDDVRRKFDMFLKSQLSDDDLASYIDRQFSPKYTKADAVQWLNEIISTKGKKVKKGAFIYDMLYQIGFTPKAKYNKGKTDKEKYDLVKNIYPIN